MLLVEWGDRLAALLTAEQTNYDLVAEDLRVVHERAHVAALDGQRANGAVHDEAPGPSAEANCRQLSRGPKSGLDP